MAILNNLIVNGAIRCLNKIYVNDIDVASSLNVNSLDVAGDIVTNSELYVGQGTESKAVIHLNNKTFVKTENGWITIDPTQEWTNGLYINSKLFKANGLQIGNNGSLVNITNAAFTSNLPSYFNSAMVINSDLSANTITSSKGVFDFVNVLDELRATKYTIDSVASLSGSFYVSPTILFDTGNTIVNITSVNNDNTIQLRVINSTLITADNVGGVVWKQYSKVKVSGKIGDVSLGTCSGYLTSKMNESANALDIRLTIPEDVTFNVGNNISNSDLRIMIYEVGNGSVNDTLPVGILLTGYSYNNSSIIDIYNGENSRTKPRVRIGKLDELDASVTVANVRPTGWGFYSDNAFLRGVLYSTAGQIGGWVIGENTLSNGTIGTDNSLFLISNGNSDSANIGGSGANTNWRITAGSHFGVTKDGQLYSNQGKLGGWTIGTNAIYNGTNSMSSVVSGLYLGTDGIRSYNSNNQLYVNIQNGTIAANSVDLTGKITATSGKIGNINVASNAIYSGSKNSLDSTSNGFYISSDGKINIGNSNQYFKFDGTNFNLAVNSLHVDGVKAATVDEIADLDVGGRNLIINTLNPDVSRVPKIAGSNVETIIRGTISTATHGIKINSSANYPSIQFGSSNIQTASLQGLKADRDYTLSFDCYYKLFSGIPSLDNDYSLRVSVVYGNANLNSNVRHILHTYSSSDASDRGVVLNTRCEFTFHIPEDANMMYILIAPSTPANTLFAASDYIELRNLIMTSGNFVTDWSPAPEDINLGLLDSASSASDYLHYDSNNGLVIYYVGEMDENETSEHYINNGHYAQIKGDSINFVAGGKLVSSYGTDVKFYYADTGNKAISIDGTNGIQLYKTDGTTRSGVLNADGLVIETGRIGSVEESKSWLIETGRISALDTNNKYVGMAVKDYGYAFYAGGTQVGGGDAPFRVDHDGVLYSTDGHFTGEVNATSGVIGGCRISNGRLIIGGDNISSDYKAEDDIIVGTQTSATGTFLGNANFSTLSNGREISYWLPYNYSTTNAVSYTPSQGTAATGAALKLKLKDGTETDAIPIFYNSLTRLTNQYDAGNVIKLTYRTNAVIDGKIVDKGFWCDANYNHEFYDRTRWNNTIKAKENIPKGCICVGTADGFIPVSSGVSFDISYPILYVDETVTRNGTTTELYTQIPNVDLTITRNNFMGIANKTVYLTGVLNGKTFTVDSYVFTTTEPTIPANRYYIPIGIMYTTTQCYFYWRGEIYTYTDGAFQNIGNGANSIVTKWAYQGDTTFIDGGNLYTSTVTADKVNVTDLSAFNATIGGFHINADSIYSGTKSTFESNNQGIYLGKDGKLDIGSGTQYLRFDGSNLNLKVKSLTVDGKDPAFQVDVDNMAVGGRNLLLDTSTLKNNNNYPTATYSFGDIIPIAGNSYTIQIKGQLDPNCTYWGIFNSGSRVKLIDLTSDNYDSTTGIWTGTFQWVNKSGDNTVTPTSINIYPLPNQDTNRQNSRIEWIKLEKGTMATDWTPAIEDINIEIANAANTASNYLSFDDTNGLVISPTGQIATGFNTQITSNGVAIRQDATTLVNYGRTTIFYRDIPTDNYHQRAVEIGSEGVKLYYRQLDSYQLGAELNAEGLDVKVGKLGGWTIDSNSIYYGYKEENGSNNAILSSADLHRTVSSTWERNDFRFIIGNDFGVTKDGHLYANNVSIKGVIEATSGTFSGTLSSVDGTFSGKLSGVTGDFSGTIRANSGDIGGFAINDHSLFSGDLLLDTTGYFMLSTEDFTRKIGLASRSGLRFAVGYNFGVSREGNLYCANADISGTVYATDGEFTGKIVANTGTIGGFNISTTSNTGATSNGGHCFAKSLYTHALVDGYEYEIGISGDMTESDPDDIFETGFDDPMFYVKSVQQGRAWNTATDQFYISKTGGLMCHSAVIDGGQIGGFIIESDYLWSADIKLASKGFSNTEYGNNEKRMIEVGDGKFYVGQLGNVKANYISAKQVYSDITRTSIVGLYYDSTSFNPAYITFDSSNNSINFNADVITGLTNYVTATALANYNYVTATVLANYNYATQTWVENKNYLTSSSLSTYATKTWVEGKNYLTSSSLSGYATQSWVTNKGYLTNSDFSTQFEWYASDYMPTSGGTFTGTINLGTSVRFGTAANSLEEGAATGGSDLYVGSGGYVKRRPSSSIRYKVIKDELTDVQDYYNINVYNAKYKEGYSEDEDYMPMFIAENVYEHMPEAVSFNENGEVENWGYRVMIPAMFAMIKSQKQEIEELKALLSERK